MKAVYLLNQDEGRRETSADFTSMPAVNQVVRPGSD